jgi:hypothetical protein
MKPLPIEPLFTERPDFFAHPLAARATRQTTAPGDWVKLVFRLPGGELKQVWLVVEVADNSRPGVGCVGRLAPWGHGSVLEPLFTKPVRFGAEHVYRRLTSNN